MQHLSLITAIISMSIIHTMHCINLECLYSDRNDHGYKCDVSSLRIVSKDDREVLKVLGNHNNPRRGDESVKFFDVIGKTVNFFPQNLHEFFPHLEILQVYGSNLREVSGNDLRNFSESLKFLWLSTNEIEIIEQNLFENTKNLEWVDFSYNKINHVDARSFESLTQLKSLAFDTNLCHSGNAVNDPTAVAVLVDKIEAKCIDVVYARKERQLFKGNFLIDENKFIKIPFRANFIA